jgi:cyclase
MRTLHRRELLRLLACAAPGLPLFGQSAAAPKTTRLAKNVLLIGGAGANVVVLTGPDGALLVDGGLAENSPELLKTIASETGGLPVRVLFNTHWHPEQTGSNAAVRQAGGKIVAHENTRLWMGAQVRVEWQKRTYPPQPAAALPSETFYSTGKMTFGGETIQYGHLPQAHTDGDLYVYLPGPNILAAGDVVSVGKYPILDYSTGGWIGGMVQASKTLLSVANADTRIVPASGPVQTRADLEAQNAMLSTVMDRLLKLIRQGMSAQDMIAAKPTAEFDQKWGDPELFIANAYPGLWGHVRELGGIV